MRTTIITPTTGAPELEFACETVARQTRPCEHLIVIDGEKFIFPAMQIIHRVMREFDGIYDPTIIELPFNTGKDKMNGHRIYAGISQLISTEFFSMLDEDNGLKPDWIERMEAAIGDPILYYATCRRQVWSRNLDRFIGHDSHESVGNNKYGYRLYDTNTWLMRTDLMHKFMPHMIVPQVGDRMLTEQVIEMPHAHIIYYGTIYRAPENLYDFFAHN
jgi:hypothetical protein